MIDRAMHFWVPRLINTTIKKMDGLGEFAYHTHIEEATWKNAVVALPDKILNCPSVTWAILKSYISVASNTLLTVIYNRAVELTVLNTFGKLFDNLINVLISIVPFYTMYQQIVGV